MRRINDVSNIRVIIRNRTCKGYYQQSSLQTLLIFHRCLIQPKDYLFKGIVIFSKFFLSRLKLIYLWIIKSLYWICRYISSLYSKARVPLKSLDLTLATGYPSTDCLCILQM